ncbi:WD40/YVTN/BNR-like repeat-containing protein [Lutibacter citreus]|uniref:WD40/YVTN/BNR-like repeat-containing protein n=1 Tax=Lutibacter citreus TaxID=2138210 RepID=UPI000DBE8205|nr:oxidoreductase [Lutibacter citreus]
MKKTLFAILCFTLIISCNNYVPRETITVHLEKTKIDSSSIRAIEVINDSTVIYAGSNGDIAVLSGKKKKFIASKIITDTIIPHFRSLATTKKAVFALNVANPALLYKYENNTIDIVYKEENEKVFYDSMAFFDTLNGIAVGDPTDNCLSILITRDGGNSWGKMKCEDLPKINQGEALFSASNTNISIVGEHAWIATGGLKARVFHSPDMGLTWEVYDTPIIKGKSTTGIYSIDFYNEKQGIICGGDYLDKFGDLANKAITKNGGKTWEIVAENSAPKYVSCVQYVPETEGMELFAVSTNGIFFSNNYGNNWQKISDEEFYSIRFFDKNTAWLSGNKVIAKMTIQ